MMLGMSAEPPAPDTLMPSASEIYEMIRQAAYYRAEKRGFTPVSRPKTRAHAEAEVLARLRAAT